MDPITLAGLAAVAAGCVCIYLAAENQRWLRSPWPRLPARAAGAVLLAAGWLCVAQSAQRVTTIFIFVTALMLVFAILPYLGALLHARRSR